MITKLLNRPLIFLQPTTTFRKLILLDEIEKDPKITQSKLAKRANIVPAMVNNYIKEFIREGYLKVEGNNRVMKYTVTPDGERFKFNLLISYSQEAVSLYKHVKEETKAKLQKFLGENIKRVVLYGAAETAEITLTAAEEVKLEIIGVVDSDPAKQGREFFGHKIQPAERIGLMNPDAIIISSSGFQDELYEKIKKYEQNGIKVKKL